MFKRVLLFLLIFLFFNHSLLASEQILNKKAAAIVNKQLEIKNFQVDIALEITAFSEKKSNFRFTYYYMEPDRIYLETEDFVLLPVEAIKTLQPGFFHLDRYRWGFRETRDNLQIFELQPLADQGKYRLLLWLDLEASLIKYAEIYFLMEDLQQEFAVQINYNQVEGFSLPVSVEGRLAVPTKIGIDGKIKDYREGVFTLELSNYKINKGIPGEIVKKLKIQGE